MGENAEPRWSTRGDEPYVIYYMAGGGYGGYKLCKKDIVNNGPEVVVKDFTSVLSMTADEYLYCDSEGIPSMDMRMWGFMRVSSGGNQNAREFVVYDVVKDTVARAKPLVGGSPVAGFYGISAGSWITNTNEFGWRPNAVSMSPRGDRFSWLISHVYPGSYNEPAAGSSMDMPHSVSSLDFSDPIVFASTESHGSWYWGPNMEQAWCHQNSRTDHMDCTLDILNPANMYRDSGEW
jgi:hypothetical protein